MENCKFTTSRSVKRYKFLFVLAIFLSSFLSVYAEDVSNYVEENIHIQFRECTSKTSTEPY